MSISNLKNHKQNKRIKTTTTMKFSYTNITVILSLFLLVSCKQHKQPKRIVSEQKVVQAAIKGEKSKGQQLVIKNDDQEIKSVTASIKGATASSWSLQASVPSTIAAGESVELTVVFQPELNFIGIATDSLVLHIGQEKEIVYELRGLSTKALEGKNEPPLADVVNTLGYGIDVGWSSLGNTVDPDLQGDELPPSLFRKAGSGLVQMIPVARYSPPFRLPYGYYIQELDSITKNEIGVLAGSDAYPEHQTLNPALERGKISFDPGNMLFGLYTTSPSHDAFSEDKWNALWFKKNVAHATRIYQLKNAKGEFIKNEYLVCFEEASNGDYQDYVFVLKNIEAVPSDNKIIM